MSHWTASIDKTSTPCGRIPLSVGLLVAAGLVLQGCVVGPNFTIPTGPPVSTYTPERALKPTSATAVEGGRTQSFAMGRDVSGGWWKLFQSKQIDAFVAEAIHNHPDIAAAQFALRSARELTKAEQGGLFPTIDTSGSAARERTPSPPSLFNLYNSSVNVSYAVDVFGGTRRQIESRQAEADAVRFELEATYLALTANVVTAAITDASLKAQISATKDIIQSQRAQLARVQGQFQLGAISRSDVLSQQATLAQTEATLPPLQKQLAQQRNQLMAYLGRFPSQDRGEGVDLATLRLPRTLPVSLPSMLVRQRPDIRAAEATLHQATADVGVAMADMLPQITLSGSYGSSAMTLGTMFSPSTIAWNVAGSVTQRIFDGGTLFHTKEAEVATYRQNLEQYKSTVIAAFQNVADALRAIQYDADALKAQAAAEKASLESLTIAEEQYKSGAVAFVTVVNAQQTFQDARIFRVKAQAARFVDTVALFQALGGGWWNRTDETADAAPRPGAKYLAGPEDRHAEAKLKLQPSVHGEIAR